MYVDDLIDALILLMESKSDIHFPINIGSTQEYKMIDLAKKIIQLTGSESKIVFKPQVEDDPKQRKPDTSLTQKVLPTWSPKISLDEGLTRTIEYFRQEIERQG
jgi:UDP-glucuronate decarboxylase